MAALGDTGLTLDVGEMRLVELNDQDREDGTVLYCDDDTLSCLVYVDEGQGAGVDLAAGDDLAEVYYSCADDEVARRADAMMASLRVRGKVSVGFGCVLAEGPQGIPGTDLILDLTGLPLLDPAGVDPEDRELAMVFSNAQETMIGYVWPMDASEYTLVPGGGHIPGTELISINGIECSFIAYERSGLLVREYYIAEGDRIVQISFVCSTEAAGQQAEEIMGTMTRR